MTGKECEALIEYTLKAGREMMECGAEAWRADNTMSRILQAYGLEVLDAHTMATQTTVTVKMADGSHYTSSSFIRPVKTTTNLARLELINAAARQICAEPPEIQDLPSFEEPPRHRLSKREVLGYVLGAGAFAIFFGGGVLDGIASALIGVGIFFMEQARAKYQENRIIYTMAACFLSGILARVLAGVFPFLHLDIVMIGDIMLFIPGLALVNGVRELFYADILTGMYRVIEAVLGAGAIATGYALSLVLGGVLF